MAFAAPAVLAAAWTVFAGKDVNWDLLNYHYYLPYELVDGRLDRDFFAASAQSYLNPLGYLPFYYMVSSGWHSVIASLALAIIHSTSVGLLFVIAWAMFGHLPGRHRVVFAVLAAALGAATWVFLPMVGSSFLDPLLAPIMLGGLALLLGGNAKHATLAGVLFGAAAALKYSNAIFCAVAWLLAFAVPGGTPAARLRAAAAYAAGAAMALVLLAGPWFYVMAREFGNPVFPLMNAWFGSPYGPPYNIVSVRFTPEGLREAIALPFRMVVLDRTLYSENFAPDIRFAALVACALGLALVPRRLLRPGASLQDSDWRVLAFFVLSLVLWIATSANGRYGLVVLLLAGLCLARLTERLLPLGAARVSLAVVLVLQVAMAATASPQRWFLAERWSTRWLPYKAPPRAQHEPALYLTVEPLPFAAVAPFLDRRSSFVNLRGQYTIPTDSPKLAALLDRHRGRLRVLGRTLELTAGKPDPQVVRTYDATLLRIGQRVDESDCFTIAWQPEEDSLARAANRVAGSPTAREPLSLVSCALRPAVRPLADLENEKRFSALFDHIEKSCPPLFHGQTAVTEPLGRGWSRNYTGLDARLEANGERVFLNRYGVDRFYNLGAPADWQGGRVPVIAACQGARQ